MAAASGMNNLTTLIKRLEAATSRLEDIASSTHGYDGNLPASANPAAAGVLPGSAHPSPGATNLPALAATVIQPPPQPVAAPLPPALADMDELIASDVAAFVAAAGALDSPIVVDQAAAVAKGFADQRQFLLITTKAKKPDMQSQTFMSLLKDLQQDLTVAGDIKDSNRGSPMKEHLAMIAEGITTLQWLVLEGKPADYVADTIGGAEMYGNRVLKAFKEGDQAHVKFVRSYYALLKSLQAYILKHYRTGVTWNANGVDAAQALREIESAANPAVGGAPPPPPPPPPLPNFDNVPPPPPPPPGAAPGATSSSGGGDMGAVFEQLNRGSDVTAGLRKVDKSQMTHKNPSLRAGSTVPDRDDISRSKSPGPQIKPKPSSMRQASSTATPTTGASAAPTSAKKPPRRELDGNKWLVENFDSPSTPIELDVLRTQSILISNCKATTIILRGKANALSIDNSPRTQILVDTLISSVDVIKSANFAIQITGSVPTILLDQVDGASVYLGKASLETEVFTSKCSGVNVVLPPGEGEGEDDDSVECPLPEQIRTVVRGGRLVSEIVEHAG